MKLCHVHAVAETIRAVSAGLRDNIRKPTEAALFYKYGRVCMVIDEVINEARTKMLHLQHNKFVCSPTPWLFQGILEATERDAIQRGMKMKVSSLPVAFHSLCFTLCSVKLGKVPCHSLIC